MRSKISPIAVESGAFDILQHIAVGVPCAACGQEYEVTLRQILFAQDMLHQGCPASSASECPPVTYAALADESVLRAFERTWAQVVSQVRGAGLDLVVCRPAHTH